jgi:hypothetical protein
MDHAPGVPREICREYTKGNDPLTGKPIIGELIDALTRPVSAEDITARVDERTEPRLIGPDTEDNLRKYFIDNIWTDYLPVILPTEERVEAMLKGTSHDPDEVVGELRSGYEACTFTVEQVAANAVMAGAKPEYFPVILALAASGAPAIATSTQSFARMIVVNGPIRVEIGMNSGTGALSPMNRANAVIGRSATLIALNLGAGGVPNRTYFGSQGNATDYNHITFAENEESLPVGWQPFHVQVGYGPEESAVSIFHGYTLHQWKDTFENRKSDAVINLANRIVPSGYYKSGMTLLLDPVVANQLHGEGFCTKDDVSKFVFENARVKLGEYWGYYLVDIMTKPVGEKGVEPYATWLKSPDSTLINRFRSQKEIAVVVVGGSLNDFWQAGDFHLIGSFSIDEWR